MKGEGIASPIGKLKRCARKSCNRPLPRRRRKYCGPECACLAAKLNAIVRDRVLYAAEKSGRKPPQKTIRRCLSCDEPFESEGTSNRLCANCNARNAGMRGRELRVARVEGRQVILQEGSERHDLA